MYKGDCGSEPSTQSQEPQQLGTSGYPHTILGPLWIADGKIKRRMLCFQFAIPSHPRLKSWNKYTREVGVLGSVHHLGLFSTYYSQRCLIFFWSDSCPIHDNEWWTLNTLFGFIHTNQMYMVMHMLGRYTIIIWTQWWYICHYASVIPFSCWKTHL